MRLETLSRPGLIFPDLAGEDAEALLRLLARRVAAAGAVPDGEELFRRLWEREQLGSTGVGGGVAIPHCKLPGLQRAVLAVGVARQGVDFGASDGKPVKAFFMVISPSAAPAEHLRSLALISKWLRSDDHAEQVVRLHDSEAIFGLLRQVPQP
jgi:PTS system nitrogen regulatory IIA component